MQLKGRVVINTPYRIALVLLFCLSTNARAGIITLDLKDFVADPSSAVTISADGSTAVISEDPAYSDVYLANDPFYGTAGILAPQSPLSLDFDISFAEGPVNDDFFNAILYGYDASGVDTFLAVFFTGSSGSDTVSFDLSSLDSSITTLGLEFQLASNDALFDSCATVSDVRLVTKEQNQAPLPGTILLCLVGLVGFWSARRYV